MMDRRFLLPLLLLHGYVLGAIGCVGAPEHCRGCLVALADAGRYVAPLVDGGLGTGGGPTVGTGGITGAGGGIGSSDAGTGGSLGTGGAATGGAGTGGAATGGAGTGGAATGGAGTGGAATGGAGTGGAATGGAGTGGPATGGTGTGGAATGGRGTGGAATGGRGTGGAATGGAGGATDTDLVLWYKFDETVGMLADSSGNGLVGTPIGIGTGGSATFSTMNRVPPGSLNLTSTSSMVGGYVVVPASLNAMGATTAITISAWIQVRTARAWQRVFDFGNGSSATSTYACLTTHQALSAPNSPQFEITTAGNTVRQFISMTTPAALAAGWHHLAVVLGPGTTYTGTLYIDKVSVGTNTAMTIRPSTLGATTQNWIGRSQYANDPLFDGFIDDFRIYKRALTGAEIVALP